MAIPLGKILYTGLLAWLAFLIGSELWRLWFDRRMYVGAFTVYSDGDEKQTKGKAFARQVVHHYRSLVALLEAEEARAAAVSAPGPGAVLQDRTWWPSTAEAQFLGSASQLEDLELRVQGVNIGQVLARVRQAMAADHELTGIVDEVPRDVAVSVVWPPAHRVAMAGEGDGGALRIQGQLDLRTAAERVACLLVWSQVRQQPHFERVASDDFCDWARLWVRYSSLQRSGPLGLAAAGERVEALLKEADALFATDSAFPELLRLRADLVDLLPADMRPAARVAQAQQDRLRYLVLADATRPVDQRADELDVLVRARPAIVVRDGSVDPPQESPWNPILTSRREHVARAIGATGILRTQGTRSWQVTAFVVGRGLLATFGSGLRTGQDIDAEFAFDENGRQPEGRPLRVDRVLYATPEASGLAILRLVDHDMAAHPPLRLGRERDLSSLVGRYVILVGYPSASPDAPTWSPEEGDLSVRPPGAYTQRLLGTEMAVKRVIPGRVVLVGEAQGLSVSGADITTDLATAPGTAGAPLVDLVSGAAIGVHVGGIWHRRLGKFASSRSVAALLDETDFPPDLRSVLSGPDTTRN